VSEYQCVGCVWAYLCVHSVCVGCFFLRMVGTYTMQYLNPRTICKCLIVSLQINNHIGGYEMLWENHKKRSKCEILLFHIKEHGSCAPPCVFTLFDCVGICRQHSLHELRIQWRSYPNPKCYWKPLVSVVSSFILWGDFLEFCPFFTSFSILPRAVCPLSSHTRVCVVLLLLRVLFRLFMMY